MRQFLLATIFMIFCGTLCADEAQFCCSSSDSRIQVGGNYTYMRLKPKGYGQLHGNFGGAQAIYEYRAPNRIYGALAGAWRDGTMHGGGQTRSISEVDVQERIGYTFADCEDTRRISFFTGLGYRRFGHHITIPDSSAQFNYNEIYVPVGFLVDGQISDGIYVGLNAQWMPQVYSTLKIVPLAGARWSLINRLDNFSVEMPFTFVLCENRRATLILSPFFEMWHDGETTATASSGLSMGVPRNTYLMGGVNLNFGYSF